jgi:SNF2 family DNA or RNA helicase
MIRNTRAVAKVDLPPRFAHTLRVDPTDEERALYDGIDALIREMDGTRGVSRMLLKNLLAEAGSSPKAVRLTLQRRMEKGDLPKQQEKRFRSVLKLCGGIKKTRKNRMLLNVITANPGKIIIFVKYLGTLEYVSEFLEENGLDHCRFHGSMANAEKDAQVARFRSEADILLTTEIGGEGRNLQFCNQMINYDLPWNPMKIEQRIGRIHRIGQEREVTIHNFCGAGSIEDYILDILDKKINMFEMVIGEIDMILGRIRGEQEFSDLVYEIWMGGESEEERQEGFDRLATRLKRSKTSYIKTRELDDKLFEDGYEI